MTVIQLNLLIMNSEKFSTDKLVENKISFIFDIPGKIQADIFIFKKEWN